MTTPTKLPIPSNNLLDSRFNFEKLDQIVNSDASYYTDRFGKQRLTAAGLEDLVSRIQSAFQNDIQAIDGYRLLGSVGTFNQLRTTQPKFAGQRILLKQMTADSLSGGGIFEAIAGVGYDDGGTACVPDGSTDFYWKRVTSGTPVSIDFFGAVNDGTTDNTDAFNLAFNSDINNIIIPSIGSYYVNGQIGSLTQNNGTKWIGDGNSRIIMGADSGFNVSGSGWGFSGINFVPNGISEYAIKTGFANTSRKCFIKDCNFVSSSSGKYFKVAIDLYAVWYSVFDNNHVNHSGLDDFVKNVYAGIGMRLNYCVNNSITRSRVGSCEVGISLTADLHPTSGYACEGIIISDNVLIANLSNLDVREGYYICVTNNVIDIPLSNTVNPVYFCGMCNDFSNNWISVAYGSIYLGKGESSAVRYDGSGNTFSGNVVRSSSGSNNNLVVTGPLGLLAITNNQFFFGSYAIVGGGGSNWNVQANMFSAQSVGAYDLHLVTKPTVAPNKYYTTGTPSRILSDTAIVAPMIFSNSVSVNLSADALVANNYVTSGQKFTVTVPAGYFLTAPETAIASLATGSILGVARYVKGESSSTSLVFSFVGIGFGINPGSYTFSIVATDKPSAF